MSQYEDDRDRYEEEQQERYYEYLAMAEDMDLKALCRDNNIKQVKQEFQDMVSSIKKYAANMGTVTEKQRAVLNRTWAYQYLNLDDGPDEGDRWSIY